MKKIEPSRSKTLMIKVLWITFFWFLASNFFLFIERSVVTTYGCNPIYDFMDLFIANTLAALMAGLMGGAFVLFVMEKWLRDLPYLKAILYIFLSYTLIYYIIATVASSYLSIQYLNKPAFSLEVNTEVWNYLTSGGSFRSYIIWLFITLATLIVLLVNDKYGPGVFSDFLLGKYFKPKREERIFMFLDLRSSTTIAEQLGEEKYFNFIKDVFKDATPGILGSKGEIYQYVGDEIIVSWKMENGQTNANCLRCFFDVQQTLIRKADYYFEKYNIKPEFKAGLHYGFVMAGEVGVVKRDIAFSGDVLNTTARIQDKCNELNVNILFSKYLLDKLALPPLDFEPRKMGDMLLRGKNETVVLYTA